MGVASGLVPANAIRLLLRRRESRRHRQDEGHSRRQGRGPRRDDKPRAAGSARLHHHDRGVPLLHEGEALAQGARGRGAGRNRARREAHQEGLRLEGRAAPLLRALGRARLDAGHDGHRPQPRAQRRDGARAREEVGQRAVRVGQLPALRRDVRRRGARHPLRPVRAGARSAARREGRDRARCRLTPEDRDGDEGSRARRAGTLPHGSVGPAPARDRRGASRASTRRARSTTARATASARTPAPA